MLYKKFIKRLLDILFSLVGLIILSPVIVVITVVLFVLNNGKPFFFQSRPGIGGVVFNIIKFKTMTDAKDEFGQLLSFDKRVTPFGNMLRKLSLDEIPQLINVLIGNMSLIGPRPLLIEYLPRYTSEQMRRHEVRPGVTGWAQVNGRNAISWDEKFRFDVWYVDNLSPIIDFKIILLTVKKVFLKEGVNSSENLNMSTFMGSKEDS